MEGEKKRGRGRPRKTINKLGQWIDRSRLSREQVADRLGISRQHLDHLCASTRRPDLDLAFAIEDLTRGKVRARFWLAVPKRSAD